MHYIYEFPAAYIIRLINLIREAVILIVYQAHQMGDIVDYFIFSVLKV
jgi:hypothetical protein